MTYHPEAPEDRHIGIWTYDTVEQTKHDEEEGKDIGDDSETGCKGTNPLTPGRDEHEEEHSHEKDVATGVRIPR